MRLPFRLPIPKRTLLTGYPLEEKLRTCPTHALKGPTRVRLHDPLANCTGFQPRHLAQALESLAVSTVAVACSPRSSRVHTTLSPTSTPFPFAHRQKIGACSQGGHPQHPTSWAKTSNPRQLATSPDSCTEPKKHCGICECELTWEKGNVCGHCYGPLDIPEVPMRPANTC